MPERRVTVLAGGVGGARFLQGLLEVVDPAGVTIVGNVGDDLEPYGLHVSPDLDTGVYTLTGPIDAEKGWGGRRAPPRGEGRGRAARPAAGAGAGARAGRRGVVLARRPRPRAPPGRHRDAAGERVAH